MDAYQIGRLHRLLRRRAGLSQDRLALRCEVRRWKIVRLEAGELAGLRIGDVQRCFSALGGGIEVRAWYRGAAADRLLDEAHARLVEAMARMLQSAGWVVKVEVTFAHFGERGSIDLLAWQPRRRALIVIEVKSVLGAIEGTLRPFDIKVRLAPAIVRDRFGWQAAVIAKMLVLPENRTARRAVERHATLFDATLPARSRQLRSWLRRPAHPVAGIWFLSGAAKQ